MATLRTKVIVNPVAGAHSTRRKWPIISRLLERIGLSFDFEYTEGVGHAMELARVAASDGYRYLVAVGGDGTVNEVANGILHSTNAATTALGVVSTGTGSDFVRSAGIPAGLYHRLFHPDQFQEVDPLMWAWWSTRARARPWSAFLLIPRAWASMPPW